MIKAFLILLLLTPFLYAQDGNLIQKNCISESGKTIYDIEIYEETYLEGEVRMRFFEQDVFYSAKTTTIDGDKVIGMAHFKSSRSGETRGSSWIYSYDKKENTLMDNANIKAICN